MGTKSLKQEVKPEIKAQNQNTVKPKCIHKKEKPVEPKAISPNNPNKAELSESIEPPSRSPRSPSYHSLNLKEEEEKLPFKLKEGKSSKSNYLEYSPDKVCLTPLRNRNENEEAYYENFPPACGRKSLLEHFYQYAYKKDKEYSKMMRKENFDPYAPLNPCLPAYQSSPYSKYNPFPVCGSCHIKSLNSSMDFKPSHERPLRSPEPSNHHRNQESPNFYNNSFLNNSHLH